MGTQRQTFNRRLGLLLFLISGLTMIIAGCWMWKGELDYRESSIPVSAQILKAMPLKQGYRESKKVEFLVRYFPPEALYDGKIGTMVMFEEASKRFDASKSQTLLYKAADPSELRHEASFGGNWITIGMGCIISFIGVWALRFWTLT